LEKSSCLTKGTRFTVVVICIIAAFAAVVFFPDISLSNEEYRAWPGEFLRIGAGARAMGMGNAYSAVEGDIYSSYFNPAGLATMESRQLALSIHYLSFDRKYMHLVYGGKMGPGAGFAISWIQAGTDDIIGRDLNGNPTGSLTDKRNSFAISFSKNIGKIVSFGINTKMSLWKLAGDDAKAFGFDVGAVVRPLNRMSLSFVMRDMNSRFTWKSDRWKKNISGGDGQSMEKTDKFPVYYTFGAAYKMNKDKLILSATLENVEDNPIGLDVGVSYSLTEKLILRSGVYNYTSDDELNAGSYTFGFTLRVTSSLDFDYAYVPVDFEKESVHCISIVTNYGE